MHHNEQCASAAAPTAWRLIVECLCTLHQGLDAGHAADGQFHAIFLLINGSVAAIFQ